ncbi:MAG: 2-amino-4-hydroxy-6-hydroxymethyldihydropteridine diphosphokinase [Desulfobulbaceae bacterium]|nr:2-amino-4-hydroxy-6-hydroxymethyldihydropteridine diphosphokinase [Desulfobulbaceae bacterium]
MKTAYIGIGSNLGDSLLIVQKAWAALGSMPGIRAGRLSHPYRTEPVDMVSDNWFINAAGELKTTLPPGDLLYSLHQVEAQFGRRRDSGGGGYRDRILDFDLLLYGREKVVKSDLHVPHPAMEKRLFVLLPLCEIAADVQHPVLGRSMAELLAVLQAEKENPVVEMLEWPGLLELPVHH